MSANFSGVTFPKQKVTPSDDAIVRRAMLADGILTGCALTYAGSTLTMAAGHLMICGRQIRHPSPQNWAVTGANSGYARLVITIDVSRTSTAANFDQVLASIDYASSEDGFPALETGDINNNGIRYSVAACVVSLGSGGITGILSRLEQVSAAAGGGGLNFRVVGGTAQPTDRKANTIWVSTGTKIADYALSAEAPENPKVGAVWIRLGAASPASFAAVRNPLIMLYPIGAVQWDGLTWNSMDAQLYNGSSWIPFSYSRVYLIRDGVVNPAAAGALVHLGWDWNGNEVSAQPYTQGNGYLDITISGSPHYAITERSVNLAAWAAVCVEYETRTTDVTYSRAFGTFPVRPAKKDWEKPPFGVSVELTGSTGRQIRRLPLPGGSGYLGFFTYGEANNYLRVYNVWLDQS